MSEKDRITQLVSQGMPLWEPEQRLPQVSQEAIRFSRGFIPCDLSKLVNGIAERWLPLFLSLDASVQITSMRTFLEPAPELSFEAECIFDEEPALLGFDDTFLEVLNNKLFALTDSRATEVLAEYFVRRFLSTVSKSLVYQKDVSIKYVSSDSQIDDRPPGHISIQATVDDKPVSLTIGLGIRAIEYVDSAWRRYLTRRTASRGFQYSDQLHTVSIELAEIAVEPSVLIDYVRSGTVITLETPVQSPVLVRLNEVPWFRGNLALFRGCYVTQASELNCEQMEIESGMTRVRVELARFQIDQEGVLEAQQVGAMLSSRVPAGATANLIIGGEQVAVTSIHEAEGRFALTVLPR